MQELEKMQAQDFKYRIFAKVFDTPEGKLVLDYLEQIFKIRVPDYDKPSVVYWQLGRQAAVEFIRNTLIYGEKEQENE